MKSKIIGVLAVFVCIFCQTLLAEEIKYGFTKGAVYSYKYSCKDSSQATAPILTPQKGENKRAVEFTVKSIGFQDNSFILDIGNSDATVRRYLSPNGALKGSPSENASALPFFLTLPTGDWHVGSAVMLTNEFKAFGQIIPVYWTLTLNKIDNLKSLANISFAAKLNVPDNRLYSRKISLKGTIVFNMAEGVIHKADWETQYSAKMINKELAITRSLWEFKKETSHNLTLTGVKK